MITQGQTSLQQMSLIHYLNNDSDNNDNHDGNDDYYNDMNIHACSLSLHSITLYLK